MAKQKVYIEESFVHEIEIECDNKDDIEDIIRDRYADVTIAQECTPRPSNVQYMVEDEDGMQTGWIDIIIKEEE